MFIAAVVSSLVIRKSEAKQEMAACVDKLELSTHAYDVLTDLRLCGQLCDAILKVDNRAFSVHRAVMYICSPYFRTLFTNKLTTVDQKEFVIPSVSGEMMQAIIDFAYTKKTQITSKNVKQLLPVADRLHVYELAKQCCDFLSENLNTDGCMETYRFAKKHYFTDLKEACYFFIMRNVRKISLSSEAFADLSIDEICEILSSNDLNVKSEEVVFSALIRWIDHAPEIRKCHIYRLLKTVRLGFLNTRYFAENVRSHPYVADNPFCQPLVHEALKFLCSLDLDDFKVIDLESHLAKPRTPHEVVFMVGGCRNGSMTNDVKSYDSRAEKWIDSRYLDKDLHAYHALVAMGTKIYVIGGYDGFHYINGVRSFDLVTKEWDVVAPMHKNRCYVSAVHLGDHIYAMGGFDGRDRLGSAEFYLPSRNQWTMIAPMHHRRSDAKATTLNEKIYIFGGFNGDTCLNSGEYYTPSTDQWTLIEHMRMRRTGFGVAMMDGYIYCMGGLGGISRLCCGERYNPATNTWHAIPDMFYMRSHFGFEVIDDMLFAFGGFDGISSIAGVEYFDVKTQEWYDTSDLPRSLEAFGTCVVKDIPNVRDYTYQPKPVEKSEKQNDMCLT
ncbi:kelch-like protein 10 [Mizuhopecten yessoensis]|uniref:kelch-like protein 10 n=1 Tax=Mizuhopecten yessoensis TaxID=6573 RepID=UPI000B45770C|nr:kelch-like protein 10 [Mizuhopecten yessoensis]